MGRSGQMVKQDESCYEASIKRMRYLFDTHDHVAVSFSGGKDSTCCLHIALDVAREQGRLPLRVFTFDEEAIPPETVEYMARVAQWPDIKFEWYCMPIKHRNACSEKQPYWYPWAPEDEAKWCRPLPPGAITSLPGFTRGGIPDLVPVIFPKSLGTCANVMGIRTQESMSRFRHIAFKRGFKAFITRNGDAAHVSNCYPIYDWRVEDVWFAPQIMGWDYNRAYDVMDKDGVPLNAQRCSPPYGEQPVHGLYKFKTCWPKLWGKMVDRVPGAATAARYANTELYGAVNPEDAKPDDMSWRAYTLHLLGELTDTKGEVAVAVKSMQSIHRNRTKDPMPDDDPHPISGMCWRFIARLAQAGGDKFHRQSQKVMNLALMERKKRGILK